MVNFLRISHYIPFKIKVPTYYIPILRTVGYPDFCIVILRLIYLGKLSDKRSPLLYF